MFDKIIGQENVKVIIRSMIETDKFPHAILLAGPYGTGKSETAFEIARILLCENGTVSGCDSCSSCKRARNLEHPDLHLLFPFKAPPQKLSDFEKWSDELTAHKKVLGDDYYSPVIYEKGRQIVDERVSEVQERLFETSFEGGKKVCIIILAERLNTKTANTLLKILEEPPRDVFFILTTERISSVLPTIISRCSVVRFRRINSKEIEDYLKEKGITDNGKLQSVSAASDGSLKRANALAFTETADYNKKTLEFFQTIASCPPDDVLNYAAPFIWSRDIAETEELLNGFAYYTKQLFEKRYGLTDRFDNTSNVLDSLIIKADTKSVKKIADKIEASFDMLGRNVNIALILSSLFYEINDVFGKGNQRKSV